MIHQYLSEELLHALGWTVIHSLWQGILIALVLGFVMLAMRKKTSNARYWAANFALLLMFFSSVLTFSFLYEKGGVEVSEGLIMEMQPTIVEGNLFQSISATFSAYFNQNLPLIVSIWLMGVAFFMLRMIGGLGYVFHLKSRHNQPLSNYWQEKVQHLSKQIPLEKSVELLESALIKVPMVIGYFKPVILMPMGAINGLSEDQVEAILAHELAHISRNDYLLNILQSFIETLFYFNPAVWWISANIRLERENCCDDLAVELCGNSLTYAKALVSLQEMHQVAPAFAMAFAGNKNQLLNRVRRILNQPQNKSIIMEKLTATTMLLLAMLMLSFGMPTPADYLLKSEKNNEEIHIQYEDIETIDITLNGNEEVITAVLSKNDSIPKAPRSGRQKYILKENGEETEIHIKDGEVEKLVLDGKEIPKEDYGKHEQKIGELREELSNVPAPPAPPAPPKAPRPDMPSAPPHPENLDIPVPPVPPAPPIPSLFERDSRKIISKKDSDGNTVIIIEEDGEAPIDIEIENEEDGKQTLSINGKKIDTFSEDDLIVVEDIEEPLVYSSVWESIAKEPTIWETQALEEVEQALAQAGEQLNHFQYVFPDKGNTFVLPNVPNLEGEENEEFRAFWHRYQEEYQERLKDGNLSEEWLKEQNERMETEFPNRPFIWKQTELIEPEFLFDQNIVYPENLLENNTLELDKLKWEGEYLFLGLDKLEELKALKGANQFTEILALYEEEMIKDGLIKKGKLKKFEISNKTMKINGKKQPEKYLKKYLKLLEKQQKMKLKGKSKFYFNNSNIQ